MLCAGRMPHTALGFSARDHELLAVGKVRQLVRPTRKSTGLLVGRIKRRLAQARLRRCFRRRREIARQANAYP
jgi:hypothetical protein